MKITVVGTGYVGLVTGVCLSDLGHDVVCVDIDEKKIAALKQGTVPFYESGLQELLQRGIDEDRLRFTTSIAEGAQHAHVIFIAVGTPSDEDGSADLSAVLAVGDTLAPYLQKDKKTYIVIKSTVPVGTSELVAQAIREKAPQATFEMVSNPEFLREGAAVKDFMNPDRIVVGAESKEGHDILKALYIGLERAGRPIVYTNIKSAEIIKYAANAMLATRISFMNMLSELCEKEGGDINHIARGIGLDGRIGPRFLHAGVGYGGSCFPKDVKAVTRTLAAKDCAAELLLAVDSINKHQRKRFIERILSTIEVAHKRIAVWGLAFKPRTDDMREAPAVDVIKALKKAGAQIVAFDPVAQENAQAILPDVTFVRKAYDAVTDADALIIMTEWDEFRGIDLEKVYSVMKQPLIFDGRNVYELETMKRHNFRYISIGRPEVKP